jgi:hypothetical protein
MMAGYRTSVAALDVRSKDTAWCRRALAESTQTRQGLSQDRYDFFASLLSVSVTVTS